MGSNVEKRFRWRGMCDRPCAKEATLQAFLRTTRRLGVSDKATVKVLQEQACVGCPLTEPTQKIGKPENS